MPLDVSRPATAGSLQEAGPAINHFTARLAYEPANPDIRLYRPARRRGLAGGWSSACATRLSWQL